MSSAAAKLATLSPEQRAAALAGLSLRELEALEYDWQFWARPDQLVPPGDWTGWLPLAGRGWGKTRTGAETVRQFKDQGYGRIALVAPTAADARDVMVEGESGLLAVSPKGDRPIYEPSKRRLRWDNGAIATTYSADEPDRLRGPQHDFAWADELAAWRYPEAWDMLQFGLRLGPRPRWIATTTPKPIALIRELLKDPSVHPTRGRTMDNKANLAKSFIDAINKKYAGTRLGRQEMEAELLEDTPGALWRRENILYAGRSPEGLFGKRTIPLMRRVVVAIDPATTSGEDSDETGIIVAGVGVHDGLGYVIQDLTCKGSPDEWAKIAVRAYNEHSADLIVAETNQGGEMVKNTIAVQSMFANFKGIHAKKGKVLRAEPVAALYEQQRVLHCGQFATLEDQMCGFSNDFDAKKAGYSPDRVDALVYALTELMLGDQYDTSGKWV